MRVFHGIDGFRWAECPFCARLVRVGSLEDDTRWRYSTHDRPGGKKCPASGDLLAATTSIHEDDE